MCESIDRTMFIHASDCSKTQKMCDNVTEQNTKMLKFVPVYFKTLKMCEKAVKKCCFQQYTFQISLKFK